MHVSLIAQYSQIKISTLPLVQNIKTQHIVVERERRHQKSLLLHPLLYKNGDAPQILPLDLILMIINLPLHIFQKYC
jgi:hypothetical protein